MHAGMFLLFCRMGLAISLISDVQEKVGNISSIVIHLATIVEEIMERWDFFTNSFKWQFDKITSLIGMKLEIQIFFE